MWPRRWLTSWPAWSRSASPSEGHLLHASLASPGVRACVTSPHGDAPSLEGRRQVESTVNQALGVTRLVRGYLAGLAVPQPPRGYEAVRERPLARERLFDPTAYLTFVLGVSANRTRTWRSSWTRSERTWCGDSGHGGSCSQRPHSATMTAAPGAPSSASSPMERTASWAKACRMRSVCHRGRVIEAEEHRYLPRRKRAACIAAAADLRTGSRNHLGGPRLALGL
jgi:hypothetical protein